MPPNRLILLLILGVLVVLTFGVLGLRLAPPQTASWPSASTATQHQLPNESATEPTTQAPTTEAQPPAAAPAPAAAPETQSEQPVGVAVPIAEAANSRAPATREEVARLFGGSPSQWGKTDEFGRKVGDNAWIFRSEGSLFLRFYVPKGCVVDTPTGRMRPGQYVNATDLTIYWL